MLRITTKVQVVISFLLYCQTNVSCGFTWGGHSTTFAKRRNELTKDSGEDLSSFLRYGVDHNDKINNNRQLLSLQMATMFDNTKSSNNNSKTTTVHTTHQPSSPTTTKRSKPPPRHHQTKKKNGHRRPSFQRQQLSREKKQIRSMFQKAKNLERMGQWNEASKLLREILVLDSKDAHSYLALGRLEARREKRRNNNSTNNKARQVFQEGVEQCPNNVHLLQAWALYEEQSQNDVDRARELYQAALDVDEYNPYVNHAYGLMEWKLGKNTEKAEELWSKALKRRSTAALVCSLGELMIASGKLKETRELYTRHLLRLNTEREMTEVYLAAAWLEEKHFKNYDRAEELINLAILQSPNSSRAHVALSRLEGRMEQRGSQVKDGHDAAVRRLANACISMDKGDQAKAVDGGFLYNSWANLEVKAKRHTTAQKILKKGMLKYPNDPSLLQSAGRVEERLGNYTFARELYSASLSIEPSAPTLVAYAMLELRHPESTYVNYSMVSGLFEEALLIDPRHGSAYNAYGNMNLQRGNIEEARSIFESGVQAQCADAASVYHGLAMLELSLGNVEEARDVLMKGMEEVEDRERGMDSAQRQRAVFLTHTLGMLQLNSNRAAEAMKVFCNGIARHGNSSQLLLGAALCEVKLGKDDQARALFERAVKADMNHAQAWQGWAVMEMRAGHFQKAKKLFDAGLKSNPRYGALWNAYATMEGRLGHLDTARALFAAGIKKSPGQVGIYQGWASLEMRAANYSAAKKLIGEALTRRKTLGSGWLIAAEIEEKTGNAGLVGLILRRGIECCPNDAELYCALGKHFFKRGKIQNAREIYEKGLDVNPLHAPLYHSLAELEAMVFNVEGLAKLNKRAAEIFNKDAMMAPSPTSTQAREKLIQKRRSRELPQGVSVLNERIGEKIPIESDDPMEMLADDVVQDLLRADSSVLPNNEDTEQ